MPYDTLSNPVSFRSGVRDIWLMDVADYIIGDLRAENTMAISFARMTKKLIAE